MISHWIPCECGGVYKELVRCGDDAQYPGRFFYKCPLGAANCKSIWADELLSADNRKYHRKMIEVPAGEEVSFGDSSCVFPDKSTKSSTSHEGLGVRTSSTPMDVPLEFTERSPASRNKHYKSKVKVNLNKKCRNDFEGPMCSFCFYVHAFAFAISVVMMLMCLDIIMRN